MTTPVPPVKLYEPVERPDLRWKYLRETYGDVAPAWFDPYARGWLLLSWESIRWAMQPASPFSADPDHWRDMREGLIPESSGTAVQLIRRQSARFRDGGEHARYRGALQDALQHLIDRNRVLDAVERVAYRLIAEFSRRRSDDLAAGYTYPRPVDLIGDYARRLTGTVLARLVGFTAAEADRIGTLMETVWDGEPHLAMQAWTQLAEDLAALAEQRARHPQDDVLSFLLHDRDRPAHTRAEAADQTALLFAAGYDPTTHLIGNCLRELLTDPRMGADLRSGLGDVRAVVNTVQVHRPPVAMLPGRWVTADHTIGHYRLRGGDLVGFGIAAANQSLAARELTSSTNAHLGWGTGGHGCPRAGQDIATVVAGAAVHCLFGAAPLRLAVPADALPDRPSMVINGLRELPVDLGEVHLPESRAALPEPAAVRPSGPAPAAATRSPSLGERLGGFARALLGRG
ncbi:cytochrome P450 family protein [Streptomonospora litoralis]|nr:cytochrome P450 [Streptomonospora litoralis]